MGHLRRRHLRGRHWHARRFSACGLVDPEFSTSNPADVDCARCRRTIDMADAEIAASVKKRKRD